MEESNVMTAERSLEIIRESIEQSRRAMTRDAGTPMIAWGILVAITALVVDLLVRQTGSPWWYFGWFPMMALGFAVGIYRAWRRPSRPRSIIGETVGQVWTAFAILAISLPVVLFIVAVMQRWCLLQACAVGEMGAISVMHFPITMVIILMLGLCTTITGFILKPVWIKAGGIVSALAGGVLCTVFGHWHMEVMALVAVIGLVVPGIIINMKYRNASHQ